MTTGAASFCGSSKPAMGRVYRVSGWVDLEDRYCALSYLGSSGPAALDAELGFARFQISDAARSVESEAAEFGTEVYGYDCHTS